MSESRAFFHVALKYVYWLLSLLVRKVGSSLYWMSNALQWDSFWYVGAVSGPIIPYQSSLWQKSIRGDNFVIWTGICLLLGKTKFSVYAKKLIDLKLHFSKIKTIT